MQVCVGAWICLSKNGGQGPQHVGVLWDLGQDRSWKGGKCTFSPALLPSLPAAWLAKRLHPKATPQLPNVCLLYSSPDGTLGLNANISRGINRFGLKASFMPVQVFIHIPASMYLSVHDREKLPLTDISQGLLCTQHLPGHLGTQKRKQQACLPGGTARTGVISWVLGRPPSPGNPLYLVKLWVRSLWNSGLLGGL